MKDFAALVASIDQTTKTSLKTRALAEYFQSANDADKLWTIALFSGRRPKRLVTTNYLRTWAAEKAGIPHWMFEECYPVVGDLAETITLILPEPEFKSSLSLSTWIERLLAGSTLDEGAKRDFIEDAWNRLGITERFLFNKLITGGFRIGVSQKLMTRALAIATGKQEAELAHRLMGNWTPATTTYHALVEAPAPDTDLSRPYPFTLAHPIDEKVDALGEPADWHAEWKWDGVRGQIILRAGQFHVWSRGEDLMTHRFPEFAQLIDCVPQGTVLDGEILVWDGENPLPFALLQKRIGRKTVPKSLLRDAPVILCAYDILEHGGRDMRQLPFDQRRDILREVIGKTPEDAPVRLSQSLSFSDWEALENQRTMSRDQRAEGLMLKRRDSEYVGGRKKGIWWKWKLDPLTIDAVMIYAQSGHGRRANLFTDYTFAVRNGEEFVPFTKAYSGLTDAEFRQITAWVRKNTLQKFGPVRQVPAQQVFEIAFEGIQESARHKSGVALRFPRMSRWRHDKSVADANSLDDLKEMLRLYG